MGRWCIQVVVTWTNVVVDVKCLWSLFTMDEPRNLSICCCPRGICAVRSSMFRHCSGYDCLSRVISTSLRCGLLGRCYTLLYVVCRYTVVDVSEWSSQLSLTSLETVVYSSVNKGKSLSAVLYLQEVRGGTCFSRFGTILR